MNSRESEERVREEDDRLTQSVCCVEEGGPSFLAEEEGATADDDDDDKGTSLRPWSGRDSIEDVRANMSESLDPVRMKGYPPSLCRESADPVRGRP